MRFWSYVGRCAVVFLAFCVAFLRRHPFLFLLGCWLLYGVVKSCAGDVSHGAASCVRQMRCP